MELLVIVIWIIIAAFSATVAGDKGYRPVNWALAGFFFGPIGFLAAVGLPDLKQRKYLRLICEHYGVSAEPDTVQQDSDQGDADAQRQRILGKK